MFKQPDAYGFKLPSYLDPSKTPDFRNVKVANKIYVSQAPGVIEQSGGGVIRNFTLEGLNNIINTRPDSNINLKPTYPVDNNPILTLNNGGFAPSKLPPVIKPKVPDEKQKMVDKTASYLKDDQQAPMNVISNRTLIRGKEFLEKSGMVRPGSLATFKEASNESVENTIRRKQQVKELERQGYGLLPGDKLKLKLLSAQLKNPKPQSVLYKADVMHGSGKKYGKERGIYKAVAITKLIVPKLIKTMYENNLSHVPQIGSGLLDKMGKVVKLKLKLNRNIKFQELEIKNKARAISRLIAPTLVPLFMKLSKNQISIPELKLELERALTQGFIMFGGPQSGGRFLGKSSGWWKNFGKGFVRGVKMVAKPAGQILGPVLTAAGAPEFGVPMTLIGNAL